MYSTGGKPVSWCLRSDGSCVVRLDQIVCAKKEDESHSSVWFKGSSKPIQLPYAPKELFEEIRRMLNKGKLPAEAETEGK